MKIQTCNNQDKTYAMKSSDQNKDVAKRNDGSATPMAGHSAPQDIAGSKEKPGSKPKAAGNPGSGHGPRTGNGHSVATKASTAATAAAPQPKTRQLRRRAEQVAAVAARATPVRYGDGTRYDQGAKYFVPDPVPPPPPPPPTGTAKVKLELSTRTDPALAAFGESHVAAMTDNPWFPTPFPTAADFGAGLAELEAVITAHANLLLETKNLTYQKDQIRKRFEFLFNQRAAYVQSVSNSNADVIASAGLMIRNTPTPVGALLAPTFLRVELTSFSGELEVRWNTVVGAKSYVMECAEVIAGEALVWEQVNVSGKLNYVAKQLTPTKHYAFRVAAIGGTTGVSPWSPVVQKMAY